MLLVSYLRTAGEPDDEVEREKTRDEELPVPLDEGILVAETRDHSFGAPELHRKRNTLSKQYNDKFISAEQAGNPVGRRQCSFVGYAARIHPKGRPKETLIIIITKH